MSPGMFNRMYQAGCESNDQNENSNIISSLNNLNIDKLCSSLDRVADGLNHLADVLDKASSTESK